MNKETIHIENLSIGYPGKGDVKVVADGICAGINSGELTCLLGANGVGNACVTLNPSRAKALSTSS